MFLTVHAAAGVLVAESVASRLAGFLIGVLSHLILDLIPHGDRGLNKWLNNPTKQATLKILLVSLIDLSFLTMLYFVVLNKLHVSQAEITYWTVVGALLPDFVWGFNLLTQRKIKLLDKLTQLHHKFQELIRDKLSIKTGLAVQIIVLVGFLILQVRLLS